MKLKFESLEYADCNASLNDADDLSSLLNVLRSRPPSVGILRSEDSSELTVGISEVVGSIQFCEIAGEPPYLVAVSKFNRETESFEFFCGGTPTPVESKYCLTTEETETIILHFIETGTPSPDFEWESI